MNYRARTNEKSAKLVEMFAYFRRFSRFNEKIVLKNDEKIFCGKLSDMKREKNRSLQFFKQSNFSRQNDETNFSRRFFERKIEKKSSLGNFSCKNEEKNIFWIILMSLQSDKNI